MINTEEKNNGSLVGVFKGINWRGIFVCLMSFFVGRVCLFDSFYTLGIAYVGAIYFNQSTRRWSAIFSILGILSMGVMNVEVMKYILMLVVITILREIMVLFKYQCNLKNQLIILGISIASINGLSLLLQEFTIYKLLVCTLETVVGIGLMAIFNMALSVIYENKKAILSEYELASVIFLIALFLCGVIDFYVVVPLIERIYIKDVLVFVVLIAAICMGGMGSGVVVGIIISTVLVVIGYMPTSFVGIYVFAALIGGLFSHLERIGVIFATTLGLLLGFALFNNKVIDQPILGAYLGAALVSLIIPKHYFGISNWFGYSTEIDEAQHLAHVQAVITEKLKRFSGAFEILGKQFENIPVKDIKLDQTKMNEIIEDAGESLCKDCAMCEFCWKDYIKDTYRSSYRMLEMLETKGQLAIGDIPPNFKKACINAESFAYTLGIKLDVFKEACKWKKHFGEARGLVADEFRGMADTVDKLARNIEGNFYFNKEDEKKVKSALQGIGVRCRDIMVLEGTGKKCEVHIYCQYKGEPDYKEKVVETVGKALDMSLEIEKYEYFVEERYCYFVIGLKKQFGIAVNAQSKAKNGVCGDVYSFMELNNGDYLMAVADGMGSGPVAREESETTIELLESFLEAGFESEIALKMINSALVLKSDIECYTTMDMAVFDQHTGVIEFMKMGAVTTFILRGRDVMTVKASSLPIGILNHLDMVSCKKQLKDGDIIIMVTDGVLENRNDLADSEHTFKHFILEAQSNSPEYISKFLLNKAINLMAGQEGDDMTVLVARIWKQ